MKLFNSSALRKPKRVVAEPVLTLVKSDDNVYATSSFNKGNPLCTSFKNPTVFRLIPSFVGPLLYLFISIPSALARDDDSPHTYLS